MSLKALCDWLIRACSIPELYLLLLPLEADNGHYPPARCLCVCTIPRPPTEPTPFLIHCFCCCCCVGCICGCTSPLYSFTHCPIFTPLLPYSQTLTHKNIQNYSHTHTYTHTCTHTHAIFLSFLLVSCVSVSVSVRPPPLGCSETTHSL